MTDSQFPTPEEQAAFVEKHLPLRQAERGVQSALKAIEQAREAARDAFVSQPIRRVRQNLRAVETACIQAVEAFKNYFAQDEIQIRESVLRWVGECYDDDSRFESVVADLWKSFASWTESEGLESCSVQEFEVLLGEEGGVRVRHRGEHALVAGRAREWKPKLKSKPEPEEIAESVPPVMPVIGKRPHKPIPHRASRRRPKLPVAKATA